MSEFHKADGEKVYAAMERDLKNAIIKGEIRTDLPILTEGEFEAKYKISRKSVRKAIQNLCDEDLLIKIQGSGTYAVPPEKRKSHKATKGLRILFLSNYFIPDEKPSAEYIESLVSGMSEFAFRMKWDLNFLFLQNVDIDEVLSDCKAGLYDGVVWDSFINSDVPEKIIKFRNASIPQIVLNRLIDGVSSVYYDHEAELEDTVSFLASLGHKRIAFINADFQEVIYRQRAEAFKAAIKERSLKNNLLFEIPQNEIISCAEKIFSLSRKPTALIIGGHTFLPPFLGWAGTRKIKFPEDLSLISLDDSYIAKANNPPVSVYAEPRSEIGRQALIALERIVHGQMIPGENVRIKGDLIIRKSTALPGF